MDFDLLNSDTAKPAVLIVDDDPNVLTSLSVLVENEGYEVTAVDGFAQAHRCLIASRFALMIADISLGDGDGLGLLKLAGAQQDQMPVIMITGFGSIQSAVDAMKSGAFDYLSKPIADEQVRLAVRRAFSQHRLLSENKRLKLKVSQFTCFENVVSQNHKMARVFGLVDTVAGATTTVLITGESGTGKSLIARTIHARSPRADGPFVEVSCGALPDTLLESELFGYEKGAFTGAVADKIGKFEAADGGTIFLDEIATASPQFQVKLLRVLQERRFEPVGSTHTRQVDTRVILAANCDLWQAVQDGTFREDLYYRINVVNIELPSLRERIGDIELLADHFLDKYAPAVDRPVKGITAQAIDVMRKYNWPGNVRELENCVERAVVLSTGPFIGPDDLPPAVISGSGAGEVALPVSAGGKSLTDALAEPEKQIIQSALIDNGWNRKATAESLGINRTTLYKKMKKYSLGELG